MRSPFEGIVLGIMISAMLWLVALNGILAEPKIEAHFRHWHHRMTAPVHA